MELSPPPSAASAPNTSPVNGAGGGGKVKPKPPKHRPKLKVSKASFRHFFFSLIFFSVAVFRRWFFPHFCFRSRQRQPCTSKYTSQPIIFRLLFYTGTNSHTKYQVMFCFVFSSSHPLPPPPTGFPIHQAGIWAADNRGHRVPGRLGGGASRRATGSVLRQVHGGRVHVTAGEGFATMHAALCIFIAAIIIPHS